ncbi:MAG: hypothetical protein AAF492_17910, partial [Verrucomicrobiota bacterium]
MSDSLRVNFGDIEGGEAVVARWIMQTTQSGVFTNFNAEFSHTDEFGGELTSLIDEVRTHLLIHEVLMDIGGRDRIRDFLAMDGNDLTVYESDNVDSAVSNVSAGAVFNLVASSGTRQTFTMTVPPVNGPLYVSLPYGAISNAAIVSVTRDDGKSIHSANSWFSMTRAAPTNAFDFFINLFDVNGGGTYTFVVDDANFIGFPPVLLPLGDQVTRVGDPPLMFNVVATDANLTIPTLTFLPVPSGATFITNGTNGMVTGLFDWTPAAGQEGVYPIYIEATDGALNTSATIRIYVGAAGEGLDSNGIPLSLTNWSPDIVDLHARSDMNGATVEWASVSNILYDLYYSDDDYGSSMTWNVLQTGVLALATNEQVVDAGLSTNRNVRFYQVKLAGDPPCVDDVWGVMRRPVLGDNFTPLSRPLRFDGRFDGKLGRHLAAALDADDAGIGDEMGDEVHVLEAGGVWRKLYLDSTGVWREENATPSIYALSPGQGFFVARHAAADATVTFSGKVGHDGTQTNLITVGHNLIGLSEGLIRNAGEIFSGVTPKADRSEETADII